MNIWTLILFGLKQTPDRALEILKSLRPSEWKLFIDGVQTPQPDYRFDVIGSAKKRMLIVDIDCEAHDSEGEPFAQTIHVATKLKNDGSDSLSIDSVAMMDCKFEFHSKPLKREFVVELGFKTGAGEKHLIELKNG